LKNGYGLKVYIMPNGYQFRITQEESSNIFDWYHTTGALVLKTDQSIHSRIGTFKEAEEVAQVIMKKVYYKSN